MDDKFLLELLRAMRGDIKVIRNDVEALKQFKWKLAGGSVVVSTLLGILIHFIIAIIAR